MSLPQDLRDRLGATDVVELPGGHQARVFAVRGTDGSRTIAKLLDAATVGLAEATERTGAIEELARLDPRVCRPIPIEGALMVELVGDGRAHLLTRYEYAEGAAVDPAASDDAQLMGVELARLHGSLRRLSRRALPVVAAVRAGAVVDDGSFQLLHGDFNHANVRRRDGGLRIFDFDDGGYGPVAFDVANALYMVLFASMVTDDRIRYGSFEDRFLDGYRAATEGAGGVDLAEVPALIDVRVAALRNWLDDLAAAPVGIRTATPAWHEVLRGFVRRYGSGER